jgi:hypothetical protein
MALPQYNPRGDHVPFTSKRAPEEQGAQTTGCLPQLVEAIENEIEAELEGVNVVRLQTLPDVPGMSATYRGQAAHQLSK